MASDTPSPCKSKQARTTKRGAGLSVCVATRTPARISGRPVKDSPEKGCQTNAPALGSLACRAVCRPRPSLAERRSPAARPSGQKVDGADALRGRATQAKPQKGNVAGAVGGGLSKMGMDVPGRACATAPSRSAPTSAKPRPTRADTTAQTKRPL